MKTFIAILAVLLLTIPAFSMDFGDYATVTLSKAKDSPTPFCPVSKISDNDKCMTCHEMVPDKDGKAVFGLKELKNDAGYFAKPFSLKVIHAPQVKSLYIQIDGTGGDKLADANLYMIRHPEFKKLTLELMTPGGSVMDAWRSVGIIQEMQARGIIVETRCYGLAASAGVILLVAGTEGHRYVNPHAEIMMHKVWTFSMFDFKTPDTAEDQAETLKHFQRNINSWLISRSKLTMEKIEGFIFKKDFWMTGEEAIVLGLVDKSLS